MNDFAINHIASTGVTVFDDIMMRERALDESLMESFPASDPMGSFDFRTPPAFV